MALAPYPWTALPPDIAPILAAQLPDLVELIVHRIPDQVTEYARPLEGEFGLSVRRGVEVALGRLLDLPGRDEPAFTADERRVYRQLGVGEARAGRSLEALLSAYSLGTRLTFSAITKAASDAGQPAEVIISLGESVFVYFDEVSGASVEGFAEEQSRQVGERDRRRRALLGLLLSGQVDENEARHLAGRAGWVLPPRAVVVVVPLDRTEGARVALGERVLANAHGGQGVAIVPEPAGERGRARLARALAGRSAWVGPARPWRRLSESLSAATLAASSGLQPAGGPGAAGFVDDFLTELIIGAEPAMLDDLADRVLAPLAELRPGQRDRLTETLSAWLRHRGERAPIAQELHVHTQTVGYRVGQLREIFGDALDDPDTRFEMELALRARALRPAGGAADGRE